MRSKLVVNLLAIFCFLATAPAAAQHPRAAPAPATRPGEASQFDFLVGQWDIVVRPYVAGLAGLIHGSPKLPGTWKAWRGLDGWGIEDEIRISDGSGNPQAFTRFLRVYDAKERHWVLASLDVYRASFQTVTAEWRDGEMRISGRGTDAEGKAYVTRSRFHAITPDGFQMTQDRSYDDGKTWTEGYLRIEAKRAAAAAPR